MMCGFCIAVTPLLGFLRDRTGSVIPAAIMHGTINALAGLGTLFITGGAALYVNMPGVAGIAVCLLSALFVAFLRRGRAQQAH
jgi:membrane protease YdiL (CAAX protease family)